MAKAHNKKSTAQHVAAGTYRSDRHADLSPRLRGKPLTKAAKPPVYFKLNAEEKKIWAKVVELLVAHKLATQLDLDSIAQYARSLYQWIEYSNDVETNGIYIASERGTKSNPAATFMHQAWIRCQQFQKLFGLNALSRESLEHTGWDAGDTGPGLGIYRPNVQTRPRD